MRAPWATATINFRIAFRILWRALWAAVQNKGGYWAAREEIHFVYARFAEECARTRPKNPEGPHPTSFLSIWNGDLACGVVVSMLADYSFWDRNPPWQKLKRFMRQNRQWKAYLPTGEWKPINNTTSRILCILRLTTLLAIFAPLYAFVSGLLLVPLWTWETIETIRQLLRKDTGKSAFTFLALVPPTQPAFLFALLLLKIPIIPGLLREKDTIGVVPRPAASLAA